MKKVLRHIHRKLVPKKKRHWALLFLLLTFIGISIAFYILILKDLPSPRKLVNATAPQSTQIFDRNNTLLYTIYGEKNQTFVPISSIPINLQHATIAIEDKDFYRHGAIDLRGISRALLETLFYKKLQGGSTITQQLVKNGLLTSERTVTRKVKEIILAFATELFFPKDKILEMYLNQSPYGGTSWGVEAASLTYFNKHASDLDLAQSALIAGLPEAPTLYSPFGAHPELAKQRQEEILQKMYEQKYITKDQEDQAKNEPLQYQKFANAIQAPHFVLYVKYLLEQKYGQQTVEEGGLRVTTTLDLPLQDFAQDTVASQVAKLTSYHVSNGASLVTNPATGEVLAMVGSKDYFDANIDGKVNVTLSTRQPGSSIKPINYATGLIKGLTAASPFIDQPLCFPGKPRYCPVNYDGKFHGVVQMRNALGNSINIPAIKVLKYNGVPAMIATASAMGITTFDSPDKYGLSLTLGGGEVTMLDMATAYGVFANDGYRKDLHVILKVTDSKRKILEQFTPNPNVIFGKKVLPKGVSFIISDILSDNHAREMEFGSNSELKIGTLPVSVKTGTTNDFKDNWTIGYTPQALVAVWVGNNDNTPMGGLVSGITGAAPIWHIIMEHVLQDKKVSSLPRPDNVIQKSVCTISGLLPAPNETPDICQTKMEYFIKGTEPTKTDPGKQNVLIDKTTNDLAKPGQTDNVEERNEYVIEDPVHDHYCVSCPHTDKQPAVELP